MTAKQLKEKFLKFFEKKGHAVIPSAPLVPTEKVELAGTQRVLFTTAGMHPLIPYLMGEEEHPSGKRLANVQKSLRTDDIDEVGDAWHNTFFEMLGNWSLGDYWKKEAISWSFEFITQELEIPKNKLWVTVFEGDSDAPKDQESIDIWKSLGISGDKIVPLPKKDNWWGPVGATGPCGPDTEMFVDVTGKEHGVDCRPGDGCGRFAEIWNDVFMEYDKQVDGSYKPLKQKNVDTGMGVERTIAILQRKDNVYDTELFNDVLRLLREKSKDKFNLKDARIIADHSRAAVFILAEGIKPSNKDQGYILRRLIRRAEAKAVYSLGLARLPAELLVQIYAYLFKEEYPELERMAKEISIEITKEVERFRKTLQQGIKEYEKIKSKSGKISGKDAFYLHSSLGLTIDVIKDFARTDRITVDEEDFEREFLKHQEVSRAGLEKKFAGGLADHSDIIVRGHTATHLLHQALRDVLGKQVHQTGSNITPERIRFDFSHNEKLTDEQIKKVEDIVNQKIRADLAVKKELLTQEEADKRGAIGLFREKYGEKVSVYTIGDYSIEYCGGPHVDRTSKVGHFRIIKEESLGSGQRRIRAVLE